MPVAAVPANLLAGPVAGLVMMWGCSAGLVAGVFGGPVAAVLQWPTGLGIGWVAAVARWAAELPLGRVGPGGVATLAGGLGVLAIAARQGRRGLGAVLVLVVLVGLVLPVPWGRVGPTTGRTEVAGAELWRSVDAASGRILTVLVIDGTVAACSSAGWPARAQHRDASTSSWPGPADRAPSTRSRR